MKTIQTTLFKHALFYLVLAFLLAGAADPVMAQSTTTVPLATSGSANSVFGTLASSLQGFAGVLLVIGVVIGGLLWMANKPQIAIGVLIGTAIVFGGPYLVSLIQGGLGTSGQ